MISTGNISKIIKREMYYQWHSKSVAMLFIILLFLNIIHLVGLYDGVISAYERFKNTENHYRELGIDIAEALSEPSESYVKGNTRVVTNILKDDLISLILAIQSIKPNNIVGSTLEYLIFVFCTLVFGIYASYVATYDFKYKTYKLVAVRYRQPDIVTGKLIAVSLVMAGTLATILFIAYFGSYVINAIVEKQIPVESYLMDIPDYKNNIILQLLLSIAVLLFYIIAGFSLAFLFKSMIVPTVVLLVHGLLVPVLGAYDFRNIFSFFAHQVFNFTGRFRMFQVLPINEFTGMTVVVLSVAVFLTLCYVIASKRSAYS